FRFVVWSRGSCFQEFFRPFSEVVSYTHQGKLNIYLFKPLHREPVESVVAFHLAEDRLHFYWAFTPVVLSCFRGQAFPCPGLQFVQPVIDFDYPVSLPFMALSPKRAAL